MTPVDGSFPTDVLCDSEAASQVLSNGELVYLIGSELNTQELVALARTCRRLFEIIQGDALLSHTYNPRTYAARLLTLSQDVQQFGYIHYRRSAAVATAVGCSELVARGKEWLLVDLTVQRVPSEDPRCHCDQSRVLRLIDLRSRVVHVTSDLVGPNALQTTRLVNIFAITVNRDSGRLERVYGLSDRYGEVFCWRCDWQDSTLNLTELAEPEFPGLKPLDVIPSPVWERHEVGMRWICPDGTVVRGFFPDKGDSRIYFELRDRE